MKNPFTAVNSLSQQTFVILLPGSNRQKGKASPSAPPPKYATERYGINYNQAKVSRRPPVAMEPSV